MRILQIFEAQKLNINGTVLDLGGNDFSHNISKYFKGSYKIQFADKFPKNDQVIQVDLEKDETINKTFDNVCVMNVLEHIKNYKNAINLCKNSLTKNGLLIGTVPYIFKIHYSPNDYFRYTEQLIIEELKFTGFTDVRIKNLGLGIFTNFYSSFCDYTNRVPLLNLLLVCLFLILDKIFYFVNKSYVKSYPLGYFFTAKNN